MEIGYTNIDVKSYLEEKEKEHGTLWSLVVRMDEVLWQRTVKDVITTIDQKLGDSVSPDMKINLRANGILSYVLGKAIHEGYPEAKLIKDFIHICGAEIRPSFSMQMQPSKKKVVVIFFIKRTTLKENMSPRRRIDL